jgi:hypothetical protein
LTARALRLAAGLVAALAATGAAASSTSTPTSLRLCDAAPALSARQQDRMLQFAAVVKRELDGAGATAALIARSGLNLARFRIRYSHAGISLKASTNGPWSVRQLYYACDESRPRLYDQGVAGFLLGTDDPKQGYVSIVLLPPVEAAALERVALDRARALRLLAADYSANAFAFDTRYQNCNQWVVELLAAAWGGLDGAGDLRERAQRWLVAQGYAPAPIEVGSHWLMFAAGFVPWLRLDDHPEEDRFALRFRTTMPASIETFVRERIPGARRIEFCLDGHHVVVRYGWSAIADGCIPEAGDRVEPID